MPKVSVCNRIFDAEEGTKLVLALEDHGVDIMHMCGGHAQCGTCRVEVLEGVLPPISALETRLFQNKGIEPDGHIRLSCQIRVTSDLEVKPILTVAEAGMGPGPRPRD
jgi:ferredoxin